MYKFIISSGKGGVGKTTVTIYLARAFKKAGKKVGILDADINTPNVPVMMGFNSRIPMRVEDYRIVPHEIDGIKVVSYWFDTADVPHLLWSQDRVGKILKAFCKDVDWGDTEVLLIDCPPTTSDELIGIVSMIGHIDGVILVVEGSTKVSVEDAKHAKRTFEYFNVPIIGYVKNKVSEYYDEGINVDKELGLPCLGEIRLKKRRKGRLTLTEKDFMPIVEALGVGE
jgi:Mrp family chromosome partitioning ATPase